MLLKFPVARLFLHDLLQREQMSGAQAIAAAACRYDLVAPEAVAEILQKPNKQCCECFLSAALIVAEFFKNHSSLADQDASTKGPAQQAHHQLLSHWQEEIGERPHCTSHAPALFDVILQVLTRYK